MGRIFRWLSVPLLFTAVLFAVLYVWWNYGPPSPVRPDLAAQGVGSIGWVASGAVLKGAVTLIITVLALFFLPAITWQQVVHVGVGTVAAYWVLESLCYSFWGPQTTNGGEVTRTAMAYACVLLVSCLWIRNTRS